MQDATFYLIRFGSTVLIAVLLPPPGQILKYPLSANFETKEEASVLTIFSKLDPVICKIFGHKQRQRFFLSARIALGDSSSRGRFANASRLRCELKPYVEISRPGATGLQ